MIINCPVCKQETTNPKYCSRSCAAIINNSLFPKNTKNPRRLYLTCNKPTRSKSQYCRKCSNFRQVVKYGEEKTIQDFTATYARHRHQGIRNHAHKVAKYHNISKQCPLCNYKNHSQLCHIRDIKDFPKDTKLNIVNDPKNLIFLCPNHHWDLDHDFLKL